MPKVAEFYGAGPTRVQFRRKDSRGYQEFLEQFKGHDALGSALTFRGVQLRRPTIFALEEKLKALMVPTLILIGDEDEPCIEPAVFMKRLIPRSGLVVLPQSGHTINLEEPDLFNRVVLDFLTAVQAGKWAAGIPSPCREPNCCPVERTSLPVDRLEHFVDVDGLLLFRRGKGVLLARVEFIAHLCLNQFYR